LIRKIDGVAATDMTVLEDSAVALGLVLSEVGGDLVMNKSTDGSEVRVTEGDKELLGDEEGDIVVETECVVLVEPVALRLLKEVQLAVGEPEKIADSDARGGSDIPAN